MDRSKRRNSERDFLGEIEFGTESVWFSTHPLNAALNAAKKFLGPHPDWKAINQSQTDFLAKFYKATPPDYHFVKSMASTSATELNAFLTENGFPEEIFRPLNPLTEFGCAGVMDLAVAWKVRAGETKMIGRGKKTYDAVKFTKGNGFSMTSHPDHAFPVVKIMTKSDFSVYLTYITTPPENNASEYFPMYELAQKLTNEEGTPQKLDILIFPKIDYEGTTNTEWLLGLEAEDQSKAKWWIIEAIMKSRLRLNHIGARVQNMAGLTMMRCIPPPPITLIFDRPFLIWFTYQDRVMHAAYITEAHWKDPGDEIFDPALNAELIEDIHNDSKVSFPLFGHKRIIANTGSSIDLSEDGLAMVRQLDDGTLLIDLDAHDLHEQISVKPIRSGRMHDKSDQWKYENYYRVHSPLSIGDYSIECGIVIDEHVSTFHLSIANLSSNSTPSNPYKKTGKVMYIYDSVIEKGYGDFTPFRMKDYNLVDSPLPIPSINYQERLGMIRRMMQSTAEHKRLLNKPPRKQHQ